MLESWRAKGMEGCTVVYHVAAAVGAAGPLQDYVKGNVQGTQNVLEACKRAKVPVMIHCSTEATLVEGLGKPLINVGW